MNWMQTVLMALKSIADNKIRSILTMLGIIIGVASVITLVASIQGMQKVNEMMMEASGVNQVQINMYIDKSATRTDLIRYMEEDMSKYVEALAPVNQMQGTIKYRTKTMDNTPMFFSNEAYGACSSLNTVSGRDLTAADIENRARVCVIGETVRKSFFGAMSPIGQSIKINGQSIEVVGVYAGKYGGKLNTGDHMILLPGSIQSRIFGWENDPSQYIVKAIDGASSKSFTEEMTAYAESKITPNRDYFYAWSNQQSQESSQQSSNMMSIVAGGVAGISLLVGGIGIMNIMLVSVTERTREIGIRMAIGARRRDIIGQFVIEAGAVSACGGLIGIAIGFFGTAMLGSLIVKQFTSSPWMPEVGSMLILPSPMLVIGSFLFSTILGVVFGLYPANKASKMQPVDALRTQ